MSVVVAIKENGKIYMGADSQVTCGGTRTTLNNPNNYKIWKVEGVDNCLMGSVGNLRDANIVRLMDNLISDYDIYRDRINYRFVVKSIVPDIIEELANHGYLHDSKGSNEFKGLESSFLFAYKNNLYLIGHDASVIEIDDCVAIGSGKNEAIGSLLSTDKLDPEERIIKAIKASAANDIYVDYPIIMIDSEDCEFNVINEKNEKAYLKNIKNNKNKDKDNKESDGSEEEDN